MTDENENDVVAYAFTVVPWSPKDCDWEGGEAFKRVSFDHPSETYGEVNGLKVEEVKELIEV